MFSQGYLTLRLVRLKASEEWKPEPNGLSFVLSKGGSGRHVFGNVSQRIGVGDVLVLKGGGEAKIRAPESAEAMFWSFSLCPEHLYPLFAGNEITLLDGLMEGFKATRFYPASGRVAVECQKLAAEVAPQFNLDHRSQLLRIAAIILTEEFKTTQSQRAGFIRLEDHVTQVFESLSADDILSLSVGELADRFGCSRRHLNRLFNQYFGFSVAAFKMEMRLLKATYLLRDPDAKIINVADQCGFNHLGLFNTCFKRRFGTSPGQWRKLDTVPVVEKSAPLAAAAGCPLRPTGMCPYAGGPASPFGAGGNGNGNCENDGASRLTRSPKVSI